MKNDLLRDLKFTKIRELNHGQKYYLSDNFQIASYQFNPIIIDSSLVIEADGIKLLNCNDSKTFGYSLKQIINNHSYRFCFQESFLSFSDTSLY